MWWGRGTDSELGLVWVLLWRDQPWWALCLMLWASIKDAWKAPQ